MPRKDTTNDNSNEQDTLSELDAVQIPKPDTMILPDESVSSASEQIEEYKVITQSESSVLIDMIVELNIKIDRLKMQHDEHVVMFNNLVSRIDAVWGK